MLVPRDDDFDHAPSQSGTHVLTARASRYVPPIRAQWTRERWSTWLRWQMRRTGISQRELASLLVQDVSKSDYRGAVREWLAGTRTVEPDSAFRVGEALRNVAGDWSCGAVALVAAGHYYDFMRLLQAMLLRSMQPGPTEELEWMCYELTQYAVTYVPLTAEADLFEARGYAFSDRLDVSVFHSRTGWSRHAVAIPRRERFLLRSVRHGRSVLRSLNTSFSAPFINDAWQARTNDSYFESGILDQTRDLLDVIYMTTTVPHAKPDAMWRAARAIMWEWASAVDMDFITSRRQEIDALEGLLSWWELDTQTNGQLSKTEGLQR